MSELSIRVNGMTKTLAFSGRIAAYERATVRVRGFAQRITSTLRLRVSFMDTLLAKFPMLAEVEGETQETWTSNGEDAICTLNLNTDKIAELFTAYAYAPELACVISLEDVADNAKCLYGYGMYPIMNWPKTTQDEPAVIEPQSFAALEARVAALERGYVHGQVLTAADIFDYKGNLVITKERIAYLWPKLGGTVTNALGGQE